MQSKKHSAIEAGANVVISLLIAMGTQAIIYPWFGFDVTFVENFTIAVIFTLISLVRNYTIRRMFNYLHIKGVLK